MIKRTYFFSVKVAHNDGSGKYSWWNSNLNKTSWMADADAALRAVRVLSAKELKDKVGRDVYPDEVEVIAFNRV